MTEAELRSEIAELDAALSYIRRGGQSYTIGTSIGSSRTVTMANYTELKKHRQELQSTLDSMTGRRGVVFRPGW